MHPRGITLTHSTELEMTRSLPSFITRLLLECASPPGKRYAALVRGPGCSLPCLCTLSPGTLVWRCASLAQGPCLTAYNALIRSKLRMCKFTSLQPCVIMMIKWCCRSRLHAAMWTEVPTLTADDLSSNWKLIFRILGMCRPSFGQEMHTSSQGLVPRHLYSFEATLSMQMTKSHRLICACA